MVGMLQILTYMFAFYLVLKGVEILQIGIASSRSSRRGMIIFGVLCVIACTIAAFAFVGMQEDMAQQVSSGINGVPSP